MDDFSFRSTQVGTLNYLSPEVEKSLSYDYTTDIWSTGCVIFELITLNFFRQLLKSDVSKNFENIPARLIYLIKKYILFTKFNSI